MENNKKEQRIVVDGILMFKASSTKSIVKSFDDDGKLVGQLVTTAVEFLPVEDSEDDLVVGQYL